MKQIEVLSDEALAAKAGEILVYAKPPVNNDVVYVHASAEGLVFQLSTKSWSSSGSSKWQTEHSRDNPSIVLVRLTDFPALSRNASSLIRFSL